MKNVFVISTFLFFAAIGTAQNEFQDHGHYHIPYLLDAPDVTFQMPKNLAEISGLSLDASEQYFLAIQDEEGIVFFIDRQSGTVIREIDFWKDGDYEGVEVANGDVFVVKNTGTLYRIQHIGTELQNVIKYNDFLGEENDVEGLAFDPINNRLLLACKDNPGNSLQGTQLKAIYSFSLNEEMLDPLPMILIRREAIDNYLANCDPGHHHDKICAFFDAAKVDFDLSPSAIAIHPISGYIYLASSKGKLLLVLNREGTILHIEKLDKTIHGQPEGLCFDSKGTLFISNEQKREQPAIIHTFHFNPVEH